MRSADLDLSTKSGRLRRPCFIIYELGFFYTLDSGAVESRYQTYLGLTNHWLGLGTLGGLNETDDYEYESLLVETGD